MPDPLKTVQDKTVGKAGPVRVLPSTHPDLLTAAGFSRCMCLHIAASTMTCFGMQTSPARSTNLRQSPCSFFDSVSALDAIQVWFKAIELSPQPD